MVERKRLAALGATVVLALAAGTLPGVADAADGADGAPIALQVTVSGDVMDGTLIGSDHWCRGVSGEVVLGITPDPDQNLDRQYGSYGFACHAVIVHAEIQGRAVEAGVVTAHVCLSGTSSDSFTDPFVERPCTDVTTRVGAEAATTELAIDDSLHIGARLTVRYRAVRPFVGQSIAIHTDDVVQMSITCADGVGTVEWTAALPLGATRNQEIVDADNYERQGLLERRTGTVALTDVREEFVGTALTLDMYTGSAHFTPGAFPVDGDWLSITYKYLVDGQQHLVFPATRVPAECGPSPI